MNLFNRGASPRRSATLVEPQRPAGPPDFPQGGQSEPDLRTLTGNWVIDPAHSRIGFSVRHAMVTTVRGAFTDYQSRLFFDGRDPSRSGAEIILSTASVDTGVDQRDSHLSGRDFLDSGTYPHMRFLSTAVKLAGPDVYRMTGDLTIKDRTRPVVLELTYIGYVTDPFGYERVGFDGTTTINRSEWGLTYNTRLAEGGAMVSDKVRLQLDIAAIRTTPQPG
ncbi:polyisoprenoid-binding protein [Streptomyces tauricus]|uniref:YceI family protein n=1 Tax=Streptomyces tauricus TaxID=68274 RepID=A0ABZ1JD15_9ACTN|nr:MULTISPECIES: YceI family protein [Streptomyces]MCW8098038.1 YceI family protein [Streptomyces tauricus]UPZ27159.1 YceI family protein [Streptomyces sp. LRE541]GHA10841.1 polyisoprenoid-binding protein [Streptomyces tauricus]